MLYGAMMLGFESYEGMFKQAAPPAGQTCVRPVTKKKHDRQKINVVL